MKIHLKMKELCLFKVLLGTVAQESASEIALRNYFEEMSWHVSIYVIRGKDMCYFPRKIMEELDHFIWARFEDSSPGRASQKALVCICVTESSLSTSETNTSLYFNHIRLLRLPWTVACQDPLSIGFSKQQCWHEWPLPSPEDLPGSGICIAGIFFTMRATKEA